MSLFLSFSRLLVNHSENLTFLDCRLVMMNTPFLLILNGCMSFNWQPVFPMREYMKIWQLSCVISKTLMMRFEINFHKKFLFSHFPSQDISLMFSSLFQVVGFLLLNMYLHVAWCLHSIDNENPSEASVSSLLSKRNTLFEQLDHYLHTLLEKQEGKNRSLLTSRVSLD